MNAGVTTFGTLRFTPTFLESFAGKESNSADRRSFRKALRLLDDDATHQSLGVHELRAPLAGIWSTSACRSLRMTVIRQPNGIKVMLTCSHHHGDLRIGRLAAKGGGDPSARVVPLQPPPPR